MVLPSMRPIIQLANRKMRKLTTRKRRNKAVGSAPGSSQATIRLVALIKATTIARKIPIRQTTRSSVGP